MSQAIAVLHVDDDRSHRELVAELLEKESSRFNVHTAASASDAWDTVAISDIDCVVSDYDMPGQNGIEFLQAIRNEHPELPFILFTGKGSEEVATDALRAGACDYIQKDGGLERYQLLANRVENAVSRTRSQQRLRGVNTEYQTVFENTQTGLLLIEATGDDFRCIQCNSKAAELIGLEKLDIVGQSMTDVLGRESYKVTGAYRKCIDLTEPVEYTVTLDLQVGQVKRTARVAPVALGDMVDRLVVSFYPAEATLEGGTGVDVASSQLRALVDNFPGGALFIFDEDLRFREAGGRELEQLDFDSSDIEGSTPHELYAPDIAERQARYFERTLTGDECVYEEEYDGKHYEVRTAPMYDQSGAVTAGVAVARNISEQVGQRERLERQNERLEEFSSIVSHDLRSPLQTARTRLELAQADADLSQVEHAVAALERSEGLIDDLLTLSRGDKTDIDLEPVALTTAAQRCWDSIEADDATLVTGSGRQIQADRSQLRQLLENLFVNAVEHGGDDLTIELGEIAAGEGFYVEDTGPGISEGEQSKIFQPGYSSKTGGDGSGFGLRIVKQVVELHDWSLTVTESDAGGARFEVSGVQPHTE